jgi:hypothetical protein
MAGPLLMSRRYQINLRGRPMTLRRLITAGSGGSASTYNVIIVKGVKWSFRPDQLTGGVLQGDAIVEILQDDLTAKTWPAPPRKGDTMIIDSRTWTVQGNEALYEDITNIGHSIWVRGG